MKRMEKLSIMLSCILVLGTSCSVQREFETIESLANTVVNYINQGDEKAILKTCISKGEYTKEIHDYTDAADPVSGMTAEDFWRIFIVDRRKAAVQSKIRSYRGRICDIVFMGEAEKVFDYKTFKMHRKIPIRLSLRDKNGSEYEETDNQILGSVIEVNGRFRLLNVFR